MTTIKIADLRTISDDEAEAIKSLVASEIDRVVVPLAQEIFVSIDYSRAGEPAGTRTSSIPLSMLTTRLNISVDMEIMPPIGLLD